MASTKTARNRIINKIVRYELEYDTGIDDRFPDDSRTVQAPLGAVFLSCRADNSRFIVWAMVDSLQPLVDVTLWILSTNGKIPDVPLKHIGTTSDFHSGFAYHCFQQIPE